MEAADDEANVNIKSYIPKCSRHELRDHKECILCVHGFIRRYCRISDELIQLCLLMYVTNTDMWDATLPMMKTDRYYKFDNTQRVATLPEKFSWRAAFGSIVVKKGSLQKWILNRLKLNSRIPGAIIGIIEADWATVSPGNFIRSNAYADYTYDAYALSLVTGQKCQGQNYGEYVGRNKYIVYDTITMILDMRGIDDDKYGTLSYKIGETDYGIAFDTIDLNTEFRLALSLCWDNDGYEIIAC